MKTKKNILDRATAMDLINRKRLSTEDRVKLFATVRDGDAALAIDIFNRLLSAKLDWNQELDEEG